MSREPIDVFRECFRRAAATTLEHAEALFEERADACESPIERIMFAAMAFEEVVGIGLGERPQEPLFWAPNGPDEPGPAGGYIAPQVKVGDYRADFVVTLCDHRGSTARVIVECDGHDWHDRTPEQAERDKSRDRDLALAGYQVLRFTGREIVRAPHDCANQVWAFLRGRLENEASA